MHRHLIRNLREERTSSGFNKHQVSLTYFPTAAVDVYHPARCREAVPAPAGDSGATEEVCDFSPDHALRVEGIKVRMEVLCQGGRTLAR